MVADGTCFGLDCPVYINELNGESIPAAALSITDDCDDAPTWTSSDASASADDFCCIKS